MLSVLIATRNRPERILECVRSVNKNGYHNYEILVIDESNNSLTKSCLEKLDLRHLRYFKFNRVGKSCALNYGIKKAHGEIVCFTDDDCVVSSNWLKNITAKFYSRPNVSAVFGRTLPYAPELNPGLICPSTFNNRVASTIVKPCNHWEKIGFGNNMAFRKDVLKKLGGFKEWLGPGSIGVAAEDADLSMRALLSNEVIHYSPDVVVHHNSWFTKAEIQKKEIEYFTGGVLCYGYYMFLGHKFAKPIYSYYSKRVYVELKNFIKAILHLSRRGVFENYFAILKALTFVWATLLALFLSFFGNYKSEDRTTS
jgi:cellulose synthase/poly-beta-1,6-N-acetylglucosamine synthase-like glycosyltransferase